MSSYQSSLEGGCVKAMYVAIMYILLCSAYDKDQNLSGQSLFSTNSLKFPLIMYSKFVWPNLIWPDICLFWRENVLCLVAIIISPAVNHLYLVYKKCSVFVHAYLFKGVLSCTVWHLL